MLEDLGILTEQIRAKREAQQALPIAEGNGPATANRSNGGNGNGGEGQSPAGGQALTDTPPVIPAKMSGRDLGPACEQCGGMMQRTGSCYTCSSCGNNTGCG